MKELLDSMRLLLRVEKVLARYKAEGKLPPREETKAWLLSLGWREHSAENLLESWYPPKRDA